MDSLNLMEMPTVGLRRQAMRRVRALVVVLMIWLMMTTSLIFGAHWMRQHSVMKLKKISAQLKAIEGRVAYQSYLSRLQIEYQTAQCMANLLSMILSRPIQGVHLTSLSFSEQWEISGILDHPRALDNFKLSMSDVFETSTWSEQFVENSLRFQMKGKQAC